MFLSNGGGSCVVSVVHAPLLVTFSLLLVINSTLTSHLQMKSVSTVIETITVFKGNISTQKGSWNLQPKDVSEVEPSQCFKNHQRTNFQALALVSKRSLQRQEDR